MCVISQLQLSQAGRAIWVGLSNSISAPDLCGVVTLLGVHSLDSLCQLERTAVALSLHPQTFLKKFQGWFGFSCNFIRIKCIKKWDN